MDKKNFFNKNIYDLSYTMRQQRGQRMRRVVFFVLLFFISLNAILIFLVSPIRQHSVSMEPTIKKDSFSLATPLSFFSYEKDIRRGEVVLISQTEKEPVSILQKAGEIVCKALTLQKIHPFTKKHSFLSRVVALPGDTIYMKDFVLFVMPNNEHLFFTEFELHQIPYSIDIRASPIGWNTQIGVQGNFEKTTLGEDEYFVLCDNRLSSMDSRIFGPIGKNEISQKVMITYFPLNAFRLFRSKLKK